MATTFGPDFFLFFLFFLMSLGPAPVGFDSLAIANLIDSKEGRRVALGFQVREEGGWCREFRVLLGVMNL